MGFLIWVFSRSGKVRMEIGGVSFCVDQGCDTFFQQEGNLASACFSSFFFFGGGGLKCLLLR